MRHCVGSVSSSLTVAANGWPSRSRRLSSSSYTGRTAACGSIFPITWPNGCYISGIFSDVEGTTVEKFFIAQKIERVKELLAYDEFSLSEIAGMLNYSSVAHLSAQFKRVTGLSPSAYKRAGRPGRLPLDKV